MNMPQGINAFLFASNEAGDMESVESTPILRLLRPATLALWIVIFAASAQSLVTAGTLENWLVPVLATGLFAAVHIQFWYEESDRGRKLYYQLERMRGRIYEDETTALPNSRHFVFELRRQMMRSVRNGRGFSLVLTDMVNFEVVKRDEERILPAMGRSLRQALGDGDFLARLQGPIFAAIVVDDRERTSTEKADWMLTSLAGCVPPVHAGRVLPVVSATGYEGELEVRDFLRRAQRDLAAAKSRDIVRQTGPLAPRSRVA